MVNFDMLEMTMYVSIFKTAGLWKDFFKRSVGFCEMYEDVITTGWGKSKLLFCTIPQEPVLKQQWHSDLRCL